jgi:hypothetical protein
MPLPLLLLLEAALLLAGVYGCLVGFRILRGGRSADRAAWKRWYRNVGHWMRFLGPFCLVLAVVFPLLVLRPLWLPAWAPGAMALAVLAVVVVFAGATWRWEPRVGWPKGLAAWLGFVWLEPLVWSGIAMGALDFLGAELGPVRDQPLWAWYLGGLAFARLRTVWFTRFLHHAAGAAEG